MADNKPLGGKILTKPFLVCLVILAIAGILLIKRLIFGVGSVTNLTDGYPWGIWIAYDVVVGTALACGGYAMALLIYVLNKGEYYPLIRSAILTSVFGYTLAGVSIFFDVGRYWQLHNMFLPWFSQINSILFEVGVCIALYVLVLWIEFTPSFLEKWKTEKYLKIANKFMFIFIAIGILLPTMHQSSLGSLLIIAGQKVSPLWQTNLLPLLFLTTAITMGYSIVVMESILSSLGFRMPLETPILGKLSKIIPRLIVFYLVVRFGELIYRGQLGLALNGDFKGFMFIVENILYLIPVVILFQSKNLTKPRMIFIAAVSMLLAGSVYRFNAFLVGFDPGPGWHYFPSFSETMITLGFISIEIMGYLYLVKKLPVLPVLRHT